MKYDLEKIKEELDTLPSYDTQLYLQGDTKDMDSHEAIRNYLLVDETENDFNIPLFDLPYINSIMKKHNLVRTRVMKMKPKTCYYWHHDKTKRHIMCNFTTYADSGGIFHESAVYLGYYPNMNDQTCK